VQDRAARVSVVSATLTDLAGRERSYDRTLVRSWPDSLASVPALACSPWSSPHSAPTAATLMVRLFAGYRDRVLCPNEHARK
jgi:hypothetical protein